MTTNKDYLKQYSAEAPRVIHTRGDDRQLGREHVEALGGLPDRGMLEFYHSMWTAMVGTKGKRRGLAGLALDGWLRKALVSNAPETAISRLAGISDVTGRNLDDLLTTLVLPDLFPMLQSYLAKFKPSLFVDLGELPSFGCSSFIFRGNRFLHGRNLDFPGVAYWDRYPVIQLFERKNSLRYIGFTTAGIPLAGITGINEAQISVSLHQHYCVETHLGGVAPFVIGELVLAEATSLESAIRIIDRYPIASSWAFILTDGKTKQSCIYEVHPRGRGRQEIGEEMVMTHSNYFQTGTCIPSGYSTSARMSWDNYARKHRLQDNLRLHGRDLTLEQACQFLSEHVDGFWNEEKVLNRTVSQSYNIQSVIFDGSEMKAWFAEGDFPVHLRHYREYDLGEIFSHREGRKETTIPGYRFRNEKLAQAKTDFASALVCGLEGNFSDAIDYLKAALSASQNAEVAQSLGLVYLKLGQVDLAIETLQMAREKLETKLKDKKSETAPPEYFEISLFLARALDVKGQREKAIELYDAIAHDSRLEDTNVRRIAKGKKRYTQKKAEQFLMPFSAYIPML